MWIGSLGLGKAEFEWPILSRLLAVFEFFLSYERTDLE
jgi:hypothetical protein